MDISGLANSYIPIAVVACLTVGYCIKHISWLDKVSNEYIPTILAIIGAIIACIANGVSIENVVYGAMSGLASTGLHQAFTMFVNKGSNTSSEE